MEVKFRQGGSWKRRARAKSLQVGQENEKDQEGGMKAVSCKRGFELRDEDDILPGADSTGKRVKMDDNNLKNMDIMVEVASHDWPQNNQ